LTNAYHGMLGMQFVAKAATKRNISRIPHIHPLKAWCVVRHADRLADAWRMTRCACAVPLQEA